MVRASDAKLAIEQAAVLALAATHAALTAQHENELRTVQEQTAAAEALSVNESINGLLGELIHRLEAEEREGKLRSELEATKQLLAEAKEASTAVARHVNTLQQQLGGFNWLDARGKKERAEASLKATQNRLKEKEGMLEFGPAMLAFLFRYFLNIFIYFLICF